MTDRDGRADLAPGDEGEWVRELQELGLAAAPEPDPGTPGSDANSDWEWRDGQWHPVAATAECAQHGDADQAQAGSVTENEHWRWVDGCWEPKF